MRLSGNSLSENVNTFNRKTLSTPALLFYKPTQKQSELPYCDNHKNRVAYYAGHIDDD